VDCGLQRQRACERHAAAPPGPHTTRIGMPCGAQRFKAVCVPSLNEGAAHRHSEVGSAGLLKNIRRGGTLSPEQDIVTRQDDSHARMTVPQAPKARANAASHSQTLTRLEGGRPTWGPRVMDMSQGWSGGRLALPSMLVLGVPCSSSHSTPPCASEGNHHDTEAGRHDRHSAQSISRAAAPTARPARRQDHEHLQTRKCRSIGGDFHVQNRYIIHFICFLWQTPQWEAIWPQHTLQARQKFQSRFWASTGSGRATGRLHGATALTVGGRIYVRNRHDPLTLLGRLARVQRKGEEVPSEAERRKRRRCMPPALASFFSSPVSILQASEARLQTSGSRCCVKSQTYNQAASVFAGWVAATE